MTPIQRAATAAERRAIRVTLPTATRLVDVPAMIAAGD